MSPRHFLLILGLAGGLRAADAPAAAPTDVTSDKLDIDSNDAGTICVWQGHVVLLGTGIEVHSDSLRGETAGKGDPLAGSASYGAYKYMLVTGHVRIIRGEYVATCGRAEMFPQEDRIVLTEDPAVQTPHGTQTGAKITLSKDAAGNRHVDVEGAPDAKTKTEIRGLKGIDLASPKAAPDDNGAAKPAPPPIAK